jgi:RNA polymerase sigma factor (sigma-70 family)
VTGAPLPPFQRLLDDHGPVLWRFVRASVPAADAADCFQDGMLAALRAYPRLRHVNNLRAWLFTVVHHACIDRHRRVGRRREVMGEVPERWAAPAEPPDEALWASVSGLPPKQRAAVWDRFVGDLPYVEIADRLGCSEAAARQNVRAGLRTLRREWSDG